MDVRIFFEEEGRFGRVPQNPERGSVQSPRTDSLTSSRGEVAESGATLELHWLPAQIRRGPWTRKYKAPSHHHQQSLVQIALDSANLA